MKKFFLSFAIMTAFAVAGVAIVGGSNSESNDHDHTSVSTHVHSQGKYCRGTVGCSCPGFSPITNGEVWKQAYCKNCGHNRRYH